MRWVVFQDEPRCLNIIRDTSFEFAFLKWRWPHQTWFLHSAVPNITNNFCMIQDCIHSGKIVTATFDQGTISDFYNRRTAGFKTHWYPPQLKICCMFSREIPVCIRQACCWRRSAQVTSMFRSSGRIVVSFFRCNFLHLYHKKIWVFFRKQLYY